MDYLSSDQLNSGYFRDIGGFPRKSIITTVAEYDGSGEACIACTQLAGRYSDREGRQILKDWIRFLKDEPAEFRALHFNTRVPQALFDAVCCQQELVELRCKWGSYADLSMLRNLKKLRFLYLGSCPGAKDLTPLTELEELVVLCLENFRQIEDYSPLHQLKKLEQLVISGPALGEITIKDLDFVAKMPALSSLWLPNASLQRDYTPAEREQLHRAAPHIQGMFGQEWWTL